MTSGLFATKVLKKVYNFRFRRCPTGPVVATIYLKDFLVTIGHPRFGGYTCNQCNNVPVVLQDPYNNGSTNQTLTAAEGFMGSLTNHKCNHWCAPGEVPE